MQTITNAQLDKLTPAQRERIPDLIGSDPRKSLDACVELLTDEEISEPRNQLALFAAFVAIEGCTSRVHDSFPKFVVDAMEDLFNATEAPPRNWQQVLSRVTLLVDSIDVRTGGGEDGVFKRFREFKKKIALRLRDQPYIAEIEIEQ